MTRTIFAAVLMGFFSITQASEQDSTAVIDLSSVLKLEQLLQKVADRQVVFVSETHLRYEHHLNQLAVIQSLHEQHDDLVIGLEFIQQPFQTVLDDYIAGNIDEADMLRQTEYFERWAYDYRLYQPIFRYAREHGIPLLALNIQREVTDQVKKVGIDGLSDDLKQQIPTEIDRDDADYRARLVEIFKQHPHAEERDFERFHEVQLLWDESMAATAADWLKRHPDTHMVILAGSGHIMYGSGIPNRLTRRLPDISTAIVINGDIDTGFDATMGDYIIVTPSKTLPPSGKLGVFLDTEQSPPKISDFSPHSGAEQAGMQKGDAIVRIGDQSISSYPDIRIALSNKAAGDKIDVEVIRPGILFGPKTQQFSVELK